MDLYEIVEKLFKKLCQAAEALKSCMETFGEAAEDAVICTNTPEYLPYIRKVCSTAHVPLAYHMPIRRRIPP